MIGRERLNRLRHYGIAVQAAMAFAAKAFCEAPAPQKKSIVNKASPRFAVDRRAEAMVWTDAEKSWSVR